MDQRKLVFLLFFILFISMHLFGHGCGGHSGHGEEGYGRHGERLSDEKERKGGHGCC